MLYITSHNHVYSYYLAKIQAVQLDYSDAHAKLLQCIRCVCS
jgi:hypothetical protein